MRLRAPAHALAIVFATICSATAGCGSDDSAAPSEPDASAPPGDGGGGGPDSGGPAPDLSKCADGARNAAETDLDCGGGCAPCGQCSRCKVAADCETGNCLDGLCAPIVQSLPNLDPARRELQNLASAVESSMRCDMGLYTEVLGIVGREMYRFSEKESAYTTELLGGGTSELRADAFYIARPWATRYWVAEHAKLLRDRSASAALADGEKRGYAAFARTLIAYQLLLNLALSDDKGLRIDLADESQPPKTKVEVLERIASLLDDAKADLATATFSFPLSSGFAGFDSPAGFTRFNRALAARVAAYRQRWADVLSALNESFFDLNGDLAAGAYLRFTDVPGDLQNPLSFPQNATGEVRVAHPSFAADLTPADDRLLKTAVRAAPASQSGLASNRDLRVYASKTAPFPIVRNEELVLLYAEAKIQLSSIPDGIVSLNRIRSAHGLPVYSGAITQAALLTELLHQRRYSLFLEGHRWLDLRRYDRLNSLPADRAGDDVWPSFPIPANDAL